MLRMNKLGDDNCQLSVNSHDDSRVCHSRHSGVLSLNVFATTMGRHVQFKATNANVPVTRHNSSFVSRETHIENRSIDTVLCNRNFRKCTLVMPLTNVVPTCHPVHRPRTDYAATSDLFHGIKTSMQATRKPDTVELKQMKQLHMNDAPFVPHICNLLYASSSGCPRESAVITARKLLLMPEHHNWLTTRLALSLSHLTDALP